MKVNSRCLFQAAPEDLVVTMEVSSLSRTQLSSELVSLHEAVPRPTHAWVCTNKIQLFHPLHRCSYAVKSREI